MNKKTSIFFSVLFFAQVLGVAQGKKIDSLFNALAASTHDTTRFNAYIEIGNFFQNNNPDTAIYFHTQAQKIAEKLAGDDGEIKKSKAYKQIGIDFYIKSEFSRAIESHQKSLALAEKHVNNKNQNIQYKAKKIQAENFGHIGYVYYAQDNYIKILDYYFKALKINEEIGNKKGQSENLNNIGLVYYDQNEYTKAIAYYQKALAIDKANQDKGGQAVDLSNIGTTYYDQKKYPEALSYYFQALGLNKEISLIQNQVINFINIGNVYAALGHYEKAMRYSDTALLMNAALENKSMQAANFDNIGTIFFTQSQLSKALQYYFEALKINKETNDKQNQAVNLGHIGAAYLAQKKYPEAENYTQQAIQIGEALNTVYFLKDFYTNLKNTYIKTNRFKEALNAYSKEMAYKDSLTNKENQKADVQQEMNYQFDKEKIRKEAEYQKKLLIEKESEKKQKIILGAITIGFILVTLFLFFVFSRLRVIRKQKGIIEKQKSLVEEKNKDITDSINYAKNLQESILPDVNEISKYVAHFMCYIPKDIVSGDFYFFRPINQHECLLAAADCTGHGVPGALTSVVCSQKLNEAVDKGITQPAQILTEVNKEVKKVFRKKLNDGMDIALVKINTQNNTLLFSGANRPLVAVCNNQSTEYRGSKSAIGHSSLSDEAFTQQEVAIEKDTTFYIYSDGYSDQFGGTRNKKLSAKKLKELLQEFSHKSLSEQQDSLASYFATYKGSNEQIDDVCIIGFKIPTL
ncbi:MAG: tetratricopeptide repeat protein [Bacteroidetes bacterium]|nr:tetratricopeptide repeat protein [Bacteroidota bacterium]